MVKYQFSLAGSIFTVRRTTRGCLTCCCTVFLPCSVSVSAVFTFAGVFTAASCSGTVPFGAVVLLPDSGLPFGVWAFCCSVAAGFSAGGLFSFAVASASKSGVIVFGVCGIAACAAPAANRQIAKAAIVFFMAYSFSALCIIPPPTINSPL